MKNYVFNIYIDVSDRPKSKEYFGLIAINTEFSHKFEKNFDNKFPWLLKSKVKGKDLNRSKLSEILNFFDDNQA